MYRTGEEKVDAPQQLALPATGLAAAQPSIVAEIVLQRRHGKAVKPSKHAVKDQVQGSQTCILLVYANLGFFYLLL